MIVCYYFVINKQRLKIMGNDQTKIQKKKINFQEMFYKNFILHEQKIDQIFGEVTYYLNKNTKRIQVIQKIQNYNEEEEISKLIETMKERIVRPLPNLLTIYHLQQIKETNAFCGSNKLYKIYFEHLQRSLRDELKKRRKTNNFFKEEQLWKILISLINAIKHLHQIKIFHGEIRLENVLIDGDYHMKLVEKSLLNSNNWKIQTNAKDIRLSKGKGVLFTPAIFKCLFNQKTQLSYFDPFKADIFAIGMIILQCCSLKKAQQYYDYQKFTVQMRDILLTLYEVKKRYSFDLMNLLERMLQQDDEDRLSAVQIYEKIRKIPNQSIRSLNATLNQTFLSQSRIFL